MALALTTIDKNESSAVTVPPKTKTLRSKKKSEALTGIQATEQAALIQAAQAGYDSELFPAMGAAYLQGGQQKMMEVIHGGMKSFIPGLTQVVGKAQISEGYDAWAEVQTTAEDIDMWGV